MGTMPSGDNLSVVLFFIALAAAFFIQTLRPEIRRVRVLMWITAATLLLIGIAWPFLGVLFPTFAMSGFAASVKSLTLDPWAWFILLLVTLVFTPLVPVVGRWRLGLDLPNPAVSGSSQSSGEYVGRPRYAGVVQGVLLVFLFIGFVHMYSLLREIQREAECYLFPRRLTSSQRVNIKTYLKEYTPHDITLMLPAIDNEVALYASDFERAFTNGDWKVKREVSPLPPDGSFPKRVMSLSHVSNEKTRREYDERLGRGPPHPGKVASAALEGLGISYSDGEDPKLEDGVHKIVLIIGPRPYSLCRGNTDRKK